MPYTELAKNLMLDALKGTNPTTPITHVGLLQADAAKTGVTSSGSTFTTTAAHGWSIGDLVIPSALTGGTGIVSGDPYFVLTVPTSTTFTIGTKPSGATLTPSTALTAGTFTRYVEISGGSPAYARKAIAYAAAALGVADDSTNGAVVDVPASTVNAVGEWSASTAGTLLTFATVTAEVFASQGTYTVTDSKNDLNK